MFGRKSSVKKAMAESDGFELDFDFDDFDSSDFGDGISEDFESNSSSRTPALKATREVAKGISDATLSKQGMSTLLKKVLPSAYGEFYEELKLTKDEAGISIAESIDSLNKIKKQSQGLLRKAVPVAERNNLTKLTNMLNKLAGEDDGYYGDDSHSKEQQINQQIDQTLGELFAIQNKITQKREDIAEKKALAKEAIETTRFEGQFQTLNSIDSTMKQSMLFTNRNTFNYYRKSVELQIRQLHVLADIYQNTSTSNVQILKALNDIKLNTGLPEYAKQHNTEAFKEQARSKFFNKVHDGFLGSQMVKQMTNQLKDRIGTIDEMFGMFSEGLGEMLDMQAEGMFDDGRSSTRKGADLVGSSLLGVAGGKLGNRLRRSMRGTKWGDRVLNGATSVDRLRENFGNELVSALESKKLRNRVNSVFGSKSKETGAIERTRVSDNVHSLLDWIGAHAREAMDKSSNLTVEKYTGYSDFTGEDGQRRLQVKTINHIIPGYLARIHRELASLRSGKEEQLVEYNHRTGQFVKSTQLRQDIMKHVIGENNIENFKRNGNDVAYKLGLSGYNNIGKYEYREGITESDVRVIGEILALRGDKTNIEFLTNKQNWMILGEKKAQLIVERFKDLDKKDYEEGSQDISQIIRNAKYASRDINPNMDLLRNVSAAGQYSHITASGLGNISRENFAQMVQQHGFSGMLKSDGYYDEYDKHMLFRQAGPNSRLTGIARADDRFKSGPAYNSIFRSLNNKAQSGFNKKPHTVAELERMGSFRTGGWTGDGPKDELGGVVHNQEFVVDQETVEAMGGKTGVEKIIQSAKEMFKQSASTISSAKDTIVKQFGSETKNGTAKPSNLEALVNNTSLTNSLLENIENRLEIMQSMSVQNLVLSKMDGSQEGSRWQQFGTQFFNRLRGRTNNPNATEQVKRKGLIRKGFDLSWFMATWPLKTGLRLTGATAKFGLNSVSSTKDWIKDKIGMGQNKLTSFKDSVLNNGKELQGKVVDVYQRGIKEPVLKGRDFIEGRYRDAEGKVIRKWEDIKSNVYDENGNLVITWEDLQEAVVTVKNKPMMVKATGWLKGKMPTKKEMLGLAAGAMLAGPAGILMAGGIAYAKRKGLGGKIANAITGGPVEIDVYTKNGLEPALLGKRFKEDYYFDVSQNKYIHSATDIKGPIIAADNPGVYLITQSELEEGLTDFTGKPISSYSATGVIKSKVGALARNGIGMLRTGTKAIAGLASGAIKLGAKTVGFGIGLLKGAVKFTANKLKGLGSGFKSILDTVGSKINDGFDAAIVGLSMTSETNRYLHAIHGLLDARLPRPAASVLGDIDGDGMREGGMLDSRRKRLEDKKLAVQEKLQALRDVRLANLIGDKINGKFGKNKKSDEDEEGGFLDNIITGITSALGSKFLDLFSGGSPADVFGPDMDADNKRRKGKKGPKGKGRFGRMGAAIRGSRFGGAMAGAGAAVANSKVGQLGARAASGGMGMLSAGAAGVGGAARMAGGLARGAGSLALKGLGVAGMAYSGYSLMNNLSEGNYGSAALDAGMLGLSAATSGIGLGALASGAGAIGSGLMTAGTFLATNPIGWAILGTAAVGYGAYKAYKWFTNGNNTKVNDNVKARLMLYGFNPDEHKKQCESILEFETMMSEALVVNGTQVKVDQTKVNPKKIFDLFDIKEDDQQAIRSWVDWYQQRFEPAFTATMSILKQIKHSYEIGDAYKLKDAELLRYLKGIRPGAGQYATTASPFKDLPSSINGDIARQFIDAMIAELEKKPNVAASAAVGGITASKLADMQESKNVVTHAQDIGKSGESVINQQRKTNSVIDSMKAGMVMGLPGMVYQSLKLIAGNNTVSSSLTSNITNPASDAHDAFESIKFKSYGAQSLLAKDLIASFRRLEEVVKKDVTISGLKAFYKGDIAKLAVSTYPYFGIKDDLYSLEVYTNYLKDRFLPAYLNMVTATKNILNNLDTNAIRNAKPADKLRIATEIINAEGSNGSIWYFRQSPWGGEINSNRSTADVDLNELKKVVEQKGGSDSKTKALEEVNKSTSTGSFISKTFGTAMDKISNYASGVFNTFKNTTSNAWQSFKDNVSGVFSGEKSVGEAVTDFGSNIAHGTAANFGALLGNGAGGSLGDVPQAKGDGWANVKDTIVAAAKVVGVDPGLMAAMAAQESAFRPTVKAKTSSATGLFQFIDGTWRQMMRQYGPKYNIPPGTPPTNSAANAILGAQYIKDNIEGLKSVTPNVQPGDAYLAHFLGLGGAKKALRAGDNASFASLFPAAAKANPAYQGTIGQVRAKLTQNMFNKHKSLGVDIPIGGTQTTKGTGNSSGGSSNGIVMPSGGMSSDPNVVAQQSFGIARQAVMNDKSLTPEQKNQRIADLNRSAHQYSQQQAAKSSVGSSSGSAGNTSSTGNYNVPYGSMSGSVPNAGSGSSGKIGGGKVNSNSRMGKAIAWLAKNGRSKSGGVCARYVRMALQAGGFKLNPQASAYMYHTNGELARLGFKLMPKGTQPAVGDVIVWDRCPSSPKHGHIEICVGTQVHPKGFCSDFFHSFCPYKRPGAVYIYRHPENGTGVTLEVTGSQYAASASAIAASNTTTYADGNQQMDSSAPKAKDTSPTYGASNYGPPKGMSAPSMSRDHLGSIASLTEKTSVESAMNTDQHTQVHRTVDNNVLGGLPSGIIPVGSSVSGQTSSTSGLDGHLNNLQSSVRSLLGISSDGKLPHQTKTIVEASLKATQQARTEYAKTHTGSAILDKALGIAKSSIGNSKLDEIKNTSSVAAKESKDAASRLITVNEEILKENKSQTKLLTDILEQLRAKGVTPNVSSSPVDKVSYAPQIQKRNNTKESPVKLTKGNQ